MAAAAVVEAVRVVAELASVTSERAAAKESLALCETALAAGAASLATSEVSLEAAEKSLGMSEAVCATAVTALAASEAKVAECMATQGERDADAVERVRQVAVRLGAAEAALAASEKEVGALVSLAHAPYPLPLVPSCTLHPSPPLRPILRTEVTEPRPRQHWLGRHHNCRPARRARCPWSPEHLPRGSSQCEDCRAAPRRRRDQHSFDERPIGGVYGVGALAEQRLCTSLVTA